MSSKTPQGITQRLHGEITKANVLPEVRKRIDNLGAEPMSMIMAEFGQYVRTQANVAVAIIKAANIQAN